MTSSEDALIQRAAFNGLALEPGSVEPLEPGADYEAALARDVAGNRWVLRVPQGPAALEAARRERALLELLRPVLPVSVPDWRILSEELLAYPALEGQPGLVIVEGEPRWRMDPESGRYARSLGRTLARLHGVDLEDARQAGAEVRTPAEVREHWYRDIQTVAGEFDVASSLLRRWTAWLEDESLWPARSVLTHGETYPAHTLLDEQGDITGLLDWSAARVDDPARDFVHQFALGGDAAFALAVDAYAAAGGQPWPGLARHCHELWAAGPVGYGLYALTTGADDHRHAAQLLLRP